MNYKRNVLTFVLMIALGFSSQLVAQKKHFVSQYLNIIHTKNGQETERMFLKGEEALNFNVENFITQHIQDSDILISGSFKSPTEITRFTFNSKDLAKDQTYDKFCTTVESIEKVPFLGVATSPMEDFEGVLVENVIEGTIAQQMGIEAGDVITSINDAEIRSACDLTMAINSYEVGDMVDVQIQDENKGKELASLGYRMKKVVTWVGCSEVASSEVLVEQVATTTDHAALDLFPNPNTGIANIKFSSNVEGALSLYITDIAGREIYREEVKNFDGFYNDYIDISSEAEGLYFLNIVQGNEMHTEKIVLQKP